MPIMGLRRPPLERCDAFVNPHILSTLAGNVGTAVSSIEAYSSKGHIFRNKHLETAKAWLQTVTFYKRVDTTG